MTKYFGEKIVVDGETYDSLNEYERWCDLRLLERDGKISELNRKVKYVLVPSQRDESGKLIEHEVSYIAAFEYILDGNKVIEDSTDYGRGASYQLFSIKRKLMLYKFGIKIKEGNFIQPIKRS